MTEKQFENNFENDIKEKKYPLDLVEKKIEALNLELKLTNKERRKVFELCENEYSDTVNYINSNKEGFKKILFSPFYNETIHTITNKKDNTCFIPIKQVPRIDNLKKIFPSLAMDGIVMTMKHERQHCWADAVDINRKRIDNNSFSISILNEIESKTNKQVFDNLKSEVSEKDYMKKVASLFIFVNVSTYGAKIFEKDRTEKDFISWLKAYYSFVNEEKIGLYVDEFNNLKEDLLDRYKNYADENNINDFYNDEDKKCEELRVKTIDRLNEMAQ